MFYSCGLEEVIFEMHDYLNEEPDELIIISGYLGPSPIKRLQELPFKVTVIGGMYATGIDAHLLGSLNEASNKNKNLTILFSSIEVHSKIYIWKKNNKILTALIGSANFSANGLQTDGRETLAIVTRATHAPMLKYYNEILTSTNSQPPLKNKQTVITYNKNNPIPRSTLYNLSYDIPLYSETTHSKEVPSKSGLNWGLSNGHVADGDAYLKIPIDMLQEVPGLISPYNSDYEYTKSKRIRQSDPIELIWDDGVTMSASLEGTQTFDGKLYPKQLTSFSSKTPYLEDGTRISKKSILGRYLRERLGVSLTHKITLSDLEKYGRTSITLSLIEDGVYYADFSK